MKAGLMEIADLFVVNKADRPGADRLRHELEIMLGLRMGQIYRNVPAHHGVDMKRINNPARAARQAAAEPGTHWVPPVLTTSAEKGEGIMELFTALERHFDYLHQSGALHARRRARLRERVVEIVERELRSRLWERGNAGEWLDSQLPAMEAA